MQINNNHILAAALALVEQKLAEALAELKQPTTTPESVVSLVEAVVDRKLKADDSIKNLIEGMSDQVNRRMDHIVADASFHIGAANREFNRGVDNVKTALEAHNHDQAYSDIAHHHDAAYAPLKAFNDHHHDAQYTKLETTQAIKDSTQKLIKNVVQATHDDIQNLDAKLSTNLDQKASDLSSKIDGHVDQINADTAKNFSTHANKLDEIERFVGTTAQSHAKLNNDFGSHVSNHKAIVEKLKGKIADLADTKADGNHTHDDAYSPLSHSHDEFANFLTHDHMAAINDHVNQIDQSYSQELQRIVSKLDEKLDSSNAITHDDLSTLKEELLQAAKDSIKPAKDAHEWDFKPHGTRQGVILYKRSDWSHYKQMVMFNDNLLREIMAYVNRMGTPQGGLGMGGPAYQDPREIITKGSLNDLMDVDTNTVRPSTNDIFMWDALANQWVPRTVQDFAAVILPILENDMNKQYNKLVDQIDPLTMYVGEAAPGSATSANAWRIKKITEIAGGDISILWANGSADFSYAWDNRATLNYVI